MASVSQASFASRLARAEQLFQHINSFTTYDPDVPELKPAALHDLIDQLKITQASYTTTHHDFAEAAKEREKVFTTNKDAVSKHITLIKAYISAKKGKESQQYIDVNNLVTKIRGGKSKKLAKNATEQVISNCEKSYGSQLQNFTEIINLLEQYGADYQPTNPNVKLASLQAQLTTITVANKNAILTYGAYKPKIGERQTSFKTLLDTALRIKEMIKSQFGVSSTEYKLIKGLRF